MEKEKNFILEPCPYDEGVNLYGKKRPSITIKSGITVLVGCNGIGKTTFIKSLQTRLKNEEIKFLNYNNLSESKSSISKSIYYQNFDNVASLMTSSEGECININLSNFFLKIKKINKILEEGEELFIFFDGIDSGLSINTIVDFKEAIHNLFHQFEKLNKYVYIIISANAYELASNENCLDVYNLKYKTFKSYETYKKFILKSDEIKNQRNKEILS